jgi:hypothetical protein
MADLRSRYIEDYAGGLLNVARQELSTTGEVLAQDGLTSEGTLFVEDGSGVKSGLKLGVSLAEVVDPTTELGAVNVRYANRTYAKIRDLKIFSTAIASAQAALSEAASESISNLETTLQLLEDDINTVEQNFQQNLAQGQEQLQVLSLSQLTLEEKVATNSVEIQNINNRLEQIQKPVSQPNEILDFETAPNNFYYLGTIAISGASVTGTNTQFSSQLEAGDIFVATTTEGEDVEFTVTAFDSSSPGTVMTVRPTNKTVEAGSLFKKSEILDLKKKINDILLALRKAQIVI